MSDDTDVPEIVESEMSAAEEIEGTEKKIRIAPEPFNRSDADIILRTSDGVDFCLHKQILTISSPILDTVVKGAIAREEHGIQVSVPIVDVPETGRTLDFLFRYCYPVVEPKPETLEDMRDILDAATKYAIKAAIDPLKVHLLRFIGTAPVRVYAIACRNDLESIAREAAVVAVGGTHLEYDYPELELISASAYWDLLTFYRNFHTSGCHLRWRSSTAVDTLIPTQISWASYPFDNADGDVIIQSADCVQFQLHKLILSTASPFFRDMFNLPQVETQGEYISVIPVSESSSTLDYLFRLIYPIEDVAQPQDVCIIYDVLAAAMKYDLQKPLSIIKRWLASCARKYPVGVFLIACRYGFQDIAKSAALASLRKPILDRKPVVGVDLTSKESISPRLDIAANVLYRLIKYRLEHIGVVDRTIEDPGWIEVVSDGWPWNAIKKVIENRCGRCGSREQRWRDRTWHIPPWMDGFADKMKSVIKSGASLGTADEDSMLDQSCTRAFGCDICAGAAPIAALRAYRKLMSQRITKAMSDIHIDTEV